MVNGATCGKQAQHPIEQWACQVLTNREKKIRQPPNSLNNNRKKSAQAYALGCEASYTAFARSALTWV